MTDEDKFEDLYNSLNEMADKIYALRETLRQYERRVENLEAKVGGKRRVIEIEEELVVEAIGNAFVNRAIRPFVKQPVQDEMRKTRVPVECPNEDSRKD